MTDERADYLASGSEGESPDREGLDRIRHILGQDSTWSEPPPEVADRLMATIGEDDLAPSLPPSPNRRWPWIAAAAAGVVLVVAAALTGILGSGDEQSIVMAGTSIEPTATGHASITDSGSGWWIRLEVEGLPAAGEGTYYEAWLWNDQGDGISVGTFHLRDHRSPVVLWSGVDPEAYPSLWVTLEPEDGDPSASEQIVMRGRSDSG
ncbi:MAG: anti-sigma factor [Acidimicrobiia bacterium]|jgi:hypothetical protein